LADALSHQKPCRQKSADFDRRSQLPVLFSPHVAAQDAAPASPKRLNRVPECDRPLFAFGEVLVRLLNLQIVSSWSINRMAKRGIRVAP
jgi:hypothetical protein